MSGLICVLELAIVEVHVRYGATFIVAAPNYPCDLIGSKEPFSLTRSSNLCSITFPFHPSILTDPS